MSQLTLRTLIFAAGFLAVIFVQYLLNQKIKEPNPTSSPIDPLFEQTSPPQGQARQAFESEAGNRNDTASPKSSAETLVLNPDAETAVLVEALGKIREQPDPSYFDPLIKLSESSDPIVLRGVFMALGAVGPLLSPGQQEKAIQALMSVYGRYKDDRTAIGEGHRYTIVQALAGLPTDASVQSLVDIMKSQPRDFPLLYLGVESLGKLKAKGALPFLQLEAKRLESIQEPSDAMDKASLKDLQGLLQTTLDDLKKI